MNIYERPSQEMATPQNSENENKSQVTQGREEQGETPKKASRPRNDVGGHDCEFVDHPPKYLQTDCSICLQVLREPYIISCCGNSFCRLCIGRIQKDGKPCPLCNGASFTLMHDKRLQRTLNEFHVRCTHQKAGCQWTGELGKLDRHLNANPKAEIQLEGCSFVEVECLHCHEFFLRCVIKEHQKEQCSKRPFSCDYCREYSSTFEDVETNHWPVCPCYPLVCPNECNSQYLIERQNLNHHLAKECPLQVVDCDFHYAGCEVRLPRKDMPQHLAENFTHMSLLATLTQKLTNQLLEKDRQHTQMTMELRNEFRRENEEIRRRVDESQAQVAMLKEENETLKQHLEEQTQMLKHDLVQETHSLKDHLDQQTQAAKNALAKEAEALREEFKKEQNLSVKEIKNQQAKQQQEQAMQTTTLSERLTQETQALRTELGEQHQAVKKELTHETQALKAEVRMLRVLNMCSRIAQGPLAIYKLPLQEVGDPNMDIAKYHISLSRSHHPPTSEKVVLVVGATGAGKSTLINGMANYILGVCWEDKYRLQLITDEENMSQAHSQTREITAYTFHQMDGSHIPFTLTIIDTPGFGDVKGVERDMLIAHQIKEFLSIPSPHGIGRLHGIAFVTQASMARLTPTQKYIFDSILAIFGKDLATHIFVMTTFADGKKPPVLAAIKDAKIPFHESFNFNNSALYAKNEEVEDQVSDVNLNKIFWHMGFKSFNDFFRILQTVEPKNMQLTKKVLQEREQLKMTIQSLMRLVQTGLTKINRLKVTQGSKTQVDHTVATLRADLEELHKQVLDMISRAQQSLKRLDEIALKPDPLTEVEYIDLLIESEQQQAMPGWQELVEYLQEARQQAQLVSVVKGKIIMQNPYSKEWWEQFKVKERSFTDWFKSFTKRSGFLHPVTSPMERKSIRARTNLFPEEV